MQDLAHTNKRQSAPPGKKRSVLPIPTRGIPERVQAEPRTGGGSATSPHRNRGPKTPAVVVYTNKTKYPREAVRPVPHCTWGTTGYPTDPECLPCGPLDGPRWRRWRAEGGAGVRVLGRPLLVFVKENFCGGTAFKEPTPPETTIVIELLLSSRDLFVLQLESLQSNPFTVSFVSFTDLPERVR